MTTVLLEGEGLFYRSTKNFVAFIWWMFVNVNINGIFELTQQSFWLLNWNFYQTDSKQSAKTSRKIRKYFNLFERCYFDYLYYLNYVHWRNFLRRYFHMLSFKNSSNCFKVVWIVSNFFSIDVYSMYLKIYNFRNWSFQFINLNSNFWEYFYLLLVRRKMIQV